MICIELINIMFVERVQGQQSPLRKQLKLIAQLAHYEPTPSIPTPSQGFNYTLARQRYSEYETPRILRKQKITSPNRSEDLRLMTILETQNSNNLFPRIIHPVRKESPSFRKVQRLPTHFHKDRQQTEATRERSLTFDTPMTNEDQKLMSVQIKNDEPFYKYERNSATIQPKIDITPIYEAPSVFQYQQSESQDEDQFEKDAVPGPGTYTYSYSDFDKKSIGKKSTMGSFISQSSRFPQLKPKPQQPQVIPNNSLQIEKEKRRDQRIKKKSRKNIVPFNSQSPRLFECDFNAKVKYPGPEDYSPRLGIEEQLIKKIQRHFKGNFGSNQERFKHKKQLNLQLGPGSYEAQALSQSLDSQNFYFKSKRNRF